MEESLQQMCRTCLRSDVSLVSLLEHSSTYTFAEMLTKCTTVTVTENDLLPKKVCPNCIAEIERSYFFKIKCENSQDILQQYVELQTATKELVIPKTEQIESTDNIVLDSDMKDLTIIQALEIETHNQHNIVYKDLAEILGDEEIRVPEKPLQSDNVPMEIMKNEVLDVQRQESQSDNDSEAILQDSSDNGGNMDESGQQEIVILYCEKCSNTFESMEEFDAHSVDCGKVEMVNRKIVNNILKKCPHCPNYFLNLEKHISKYHSSQKVTGTTENYPASSKESGKKYDCPKSGNENEEVIHKVEMPKGKIVNESLRKCTHCPTCFVNERSLMNHISECHSSQKSSETTDRPSSQESDKKDDNPKSDDEDSQLKVIEPQDSLLKHDTNSLPTNKLACRHCGAKFGSAKPFLYHMKINVCTAQQFVCKICGKAFIDDKYLTEHLETHGKALREALKPKCRICGKVFRMPSTLKAHLRIHRGETPFLCSICGKDFFLITSLKRHVMLHKNHKPYECNQCGSSVNEDEFFTHIRKHTGDHPFVCSICNAPFEFVKLLAKHNLFRHKRFPTGERPYACDLCSMRFVEPDALKTHRLTHITERRFQCCFCPRWFYEKSNCLNHIANHFKDKQSKTAAREVGITKDSEADD